MRTNKTREVILKDELFKYGISMEENELIEKIFYRNFYEFIKKNFN